MGLRRLNQVVERPDTPQIRGLVAKISHLVEIIGETGHTSGAQLPEYIVLPPEIAFADGESAGEVTALPVPSAVEELSERSAPEASAELTKETVSEPSEAAKVKKASEQAAPEEREAAKVPKTKKGKAATTRSSKPSKPSRK